MMPPIISPKNLEWSSLSAPSICADSKANSGSFKGKDVPELDRFPIMYMKTGSTIITKRVAVRFIELKTVSENETGSGRSCSCSGEMLLFISEVMWPSSATLIGAEPEIPPCQTINPE